MKKCIMMQVIVQTLTSWPGFERDRKGKDLGHTYSQGLQDLPLAPNS
jgi:hypothetical protein